MRHSHEDSNAAGIADEIGQTIVEYALILSLIAIAAIGVLATMTNQIGVVFQTIGTYL
jgi:Flp pilus assembly pilin Flp